MKNKTLFFFNLEYSLIEGEHGGTILGTAKSQKEIEKDLKAACRLLKKSNKKEYLGLPYAFKGIVDIMSKKGYVICKFVDSPKYFVNEGSLSGKMRNFFIDHKEEKIEWKRI